MKDLTLTLDHDGTKVSLLIEAPDDILDRIIVRALRQKVCEFLETNPPSLLQGLPVFRFEFPGLTVWGILYEEFGPLGEDLLSLVYPPVP